MRQEEYKRLWCPMMRYDGDNRDVKAGTPEPWNACVGSGCAMWRWSEDLRRHFIVPRTEAERVYYDRLSEEDPEPKRPDYVPADYIWSPCDGDPAGWVQPTEQAENMRQGYCGLAGKPYGVNNAERN